MPQFVLVNFAPPPLVEDVLVAGKDRLQRKHNRTIAEVHQILKLSCRKFLRRGQSVVITDEHQVRLRNERLPIAGLQYGLVGSKSLAEGLQILAPAARILGADFALHSRQRLKLRHAAPGPKIRCARHKIAVSLWSPSLALRLLADSPRPKANHCSLTPLRVLPMLDSPSSKEHLCRIRPKT